MAAGRALRARALRRRARAGGPAARRRSSFPGRGLRRQARDRSSNAAAPLPCALIAARGAASRPRRLGWLPARQRPLFRSRTSRSSASRPTPRRRSQRALVAAARSQTTTDFSLPANVRAAVAAVHAGHSRSARRPTCRTGSRSIVRERDAVVRLRSTARGHARRRRRQRDHRARGVAARAGDGDARRRSRSAVAAATRSSLVALRVLRAAPAPLRHRVVAVTRRRRRADRSTCTTGRG